MVPRKVHVLYEHGADGRPYACSYIRLLRPLAHSGVAGRISMSAGLGYEGEPVDAVIVDRLWRPDVSPALAAGLVERVRSAGARLLYALDDNFPAMVSERKDWVPTPAQLQVAEFFLRHADGVIVTTPALKERFAGLNPRVEVLPNALDERLMPWQRRWPMSHLLLRLARLARRSRRREPCVIGYMGTHTHDDDLLMILPALRAVCERHGGRVALEIVGVIAHPEALQALEGLPVRLIDPGPENREYPAFLAWFTRLFWWDIALAPLRPSEFNRYKSDIKYLDYSAISAAGIYSRAPAYASAVRDGHTGRLVEDDWRDWEAALETLLSDTMQRLMLGYNALRHLLARRTLAHNARGWAEVLERLLAPVS